MYSVVRSEISPVVSAVDQSKDSYRNANWCMHALSIEFDLLYVRRRYHRLTATLLLCRRRVLGMTGRASARRSLYTFQVRKPIPILHNYRQQENKNYQTISPTNG